MIKRLLSAVCAIFIAVQTALSAGAAGVTEQYLDDIFAYNMAQRGAESFFDGLEYGSNDWTAYCYIRLYGTEGAEHYASTAEEYAEGLISSDGFVKPTDMQKAAVTLSLLGSCPQRLIDEAVYLNGDFDRQGINAYIWGLIAVNCADLPAPENALNTESSIIDHLLSKQLSDGGFSLKGTAADVDITAAAIYALAPCAEGDEEVAAAVSRARQALIGLQLDGGGFSSLGIENCESAAQAMIALSADPQTASLAEESGALAAMLSYRRADGSFAHLPDGEGDSIATAQACMALTAYRCMTERGEPLFGSPPADDRSESDNPSEEPTVADESAVASEEPVPVTDNSPAPPQTSHISGGQIKLIISAALLVLAAALLTAFFVGGRKKRALAAVAVLLSLLAAGAAFLDIRTADEYYADTPSGGEITVSVSVNCSAALSGEGDTTALLPLDGVMLYADGVSLAEGSTAFDGLIAAAKAQQLRVDYMGTSYGMYVSGIGGLYEFDFGSTSGWLYTVNGELPSRSAGVYLLADGDAVEFFYTTSLGSMGE